jgi:hypothetical protein
MALSLIHSQAQTCRFVMLIFSYYMLLLMFGACSGAVSSGTATSWKVVGLILDGVTGILHCLNPSGCTKAQGLAQLLTEMSTRDISGGQRWLMHEADNLRNFMSCLDTVGPSTSWSTKCL